MIDHFCSSPAVFDPLRSGPLGPHIDGFAELLFQQGYSREAGAQKLRLVSRLSRWLARTEIGVELMDEQWITEFIRARGKRLGRRPGTRPTFGALLQYLRQAHIIAEPRTPPALSPLDRIEQDYAQFLRQDRALTPATLHNYLPAVRRFLVGRFGTGKICLRKLGPQDLTDFILHDRSTFSPRRVQLMTSALRSFLGFFYQRGDLATNLAVSVPTVANWNLAPLPRFLESAEVEKLLSVCDRTSPVGKRNRAILLLLARLGLRAGEVVQITLEDIDWEAGELLVRGKGARQERLPLLREVGQALADYLRQRPARLACRHVFLRMVAPYRGLSGSGTVSSIVRRSLARAQLSEAINLDRGEVDLERGLLTVRQAKFNKARLVPIHSTTRNKLREYEGLRDERCRHPQSPSFFLSERGTRLNNFTVRRWFVIASRKCGLRGPADRRGPRIHDLRHHSERRIIPSSTCEYG